MKEQNIARIYAQSFIQLGKEANVDTAEEITKLNDVINASNDLENVLFLDVFTNEEKLSVLDAICTKISLAPIIKGAVNYLVQEKRISIFPLIYKEIIVIDDDQRGFLRGTIEGSNDAIADNEKEKLLNSLKKFTGDKKIIVDYKKSEDVSAGYKVTLDNLQLDASVDGQFENLRNDILNN
jgi:F-type H+-transporting ATPase subunit delta